VANSTEFTDPYLETYTQVPPVGRGVCGICHSGPNDAYTICYSCDLTMSQVAHPNRLIVPISLYAIPGQLHHVLRNYKDGPAATILRTQVAAMLTRFIRLHQTCIEEALGAPIDVLMTVPSTRSPARPGVHPLELAVEQSRRLRTLHRSGLRRSTGSVGHRNANDEAFAVTLDVEDLTVLLVEDTFTTGARAQSASSALRLAGATRVAVLTVGRVIDPNFNSNCERIWGRARAEPFDFDVCCLE
jgi:predicted amidophosphoribosyltransferase